MLIYVNIHEFINQVHVALFLSVDTSINSGEKVQTLSKSADKVKQNIERQASHINIPDHKVRGH